MKLHVYMHVYMIVQLWAFLMSPFAQAHVLFNEGVGHGGGGDPYVAEFTAIAQSLISGDLIDESDKEVLKKALEQSRIVTVPELIDPVTRKPLENQYNIVAWGSPGLIQLKTEQYVSGLSWVDLRMQQLPVLHYVFHELYRASGVVDQYGKSPDESFELSIGKYHLDNQPVFPIVFMPTPFNPVCLRKVFTENELQSPDQELSQLSVQIEAAYSTMSPTPFQYIGATVVGRGKKDQKYYGNQATCIFNSDGTADCSLECDGGGFVLQSAENSVQLAVPIHYELFQGFLESDPENPVPEIELPSRDKTNFKLEQVDRDYCTEDIERLQVPAIKGC